MRCNIHRYVIVVFLACIFMLPVSAWGQNDLLLKGDTVKTVHPQPAQKDLFDAINYVFGIKKASVNKDSIRLASHRPFMIIFPGFGYALQTGFAIACPINISFYTDKGPDANISTIVIDGNLTLDHQFFLPVISNIWTKGNKIDFQGDWRYYKYPSYTYGLGGYSSLSNADALDYSYVKIHQTALAKVAPDFLVGGGYSLDYHWNVRDIDPEPESSDFTKYHIGTRAVSAGPTLNLLYDTRRNSNNPLPGYYANIIYGYNLHALGSDNNYQTILIDLRKYVHFPASSNNTLAFWNYTWLTFNGKVPYLDMPSTGWDTYANMGRGYIQGRLRGNDLVYFETEYRIHFMPSDLLGAAVFANVESVPEYPSNKFETVYPAGGVGLRVKANKYSNVNFSIDYAWGKGNSQGFFFNLGEVF